MREMEFVVVINHEEQFSIWHKDRELPLGWNCVPIPDDWMANYCLRKEGASRSDRETCLDFIETTWLDIRPLSVRNALQGGV